MTHSAAERIAEARRQQQEQEDHGANEERQRKLNHFNIHNVAVGLLLGQLEDLYEAKFPMNGDKPDLGNYDESFAMELKETLEDALSHLQEFNPATDKPAPQPRKLPWVSRLSSTSKRPRGSLI